MDRQSKEKGEARVCGNARRREWLGLGIAHLIQHSQNPLVFLFIFKENPPFFMGILWY